MDENTIEENASKVEVRFRTSIDKYRVTEKSFQVPFNLNRRGLSQVINHLLGTNTPIPFDFLIHDQFLRTTLEAFYKKNNISQEEIVIIDYIELNDPPTSTSESTQADWISSIDNNLLFSNKNLSNLSFNTNIIPFGTYDHQVCVYRLGNEEGSSITIGTHDQPVLTVSSYMKTDSSMEIASGAQDGTINIWEYDLDSKAFLKYKLLDGHGSAVECVSYSPSGDLMASCGWDEKIVVWSFDEDNLVEQHQTSGNKKRKTSEQCQYIKPRTFMEGHMQCVSSLHWISEDEIASASWDHSVRLWDVDSGICTHQMNGNKVILALDYSKENNLIVTGHADKTVRLWDPRVKANEENSLINTTLSSHSNWVSAVKWHPSDSNLLISGSYDSNIKVWDIRAKTPLHTLSNQHTDKVFALSWLSENSFVSGGADNNLRFYTFPKK